MLEVSAGMYAVALHKPVSTSYNRLASLRCRKDGVVQCYHLARVLPTTKIADRKFLPNLFREAQDGPGMPEDAEALASAFERWAVKPNPFTTQNMKDRMESIRSRFVNALAFGVRSSELLRDVERLRKIVIISDPALRYIVLDEPIPDMDQFAVEFAIQNMKERV